MRIRKSHSWNVSLEKAGEIQAGLAEELILRGKPRRLKKVAGADVGYSKKSDEVFAAVTVVDLDSMDTIEVARARGRSRFPYIPGYLTFREGPVLIRAFRKLKTIPDAVIFDGQGIAHPRGMGLASHIGLWLDVPSIGCAKSRLVGDCVEPGFRRGSRRAVRLNGRAVGCVLRTRSGVKPVYVSPGHRIGLEAALDVVMNSTSAYRLPEPVRRAHIESVRIRKEVEG